MNPDAWPSGWLELGAVEDEQLGPLSITNSRLYYGGPVDPQPSTIDAYPQRIMQDLYDYYLYVRQLGGHQLVVRVVE